MAGNRFWHRDGGSSGRGQNRIYFSFNTNNGSNPNTSLYAGNADFINTIVGNANTGEFTVTLSTRDFYYKIIGASATLEETSTGDGASASIGNFANEGASNSAPITFRIFTNNGAGTKTNYTNRRIWVEIVVQDKGSTGTGDP